jgi:hypothetical protein
MPRRGGSDGFGASTAGPLIDRDPRKCWLGARRGGASGRGDCGSSKSGSPVMERTIYRDDMVAAICADNRRRLCQH